ncbi:DNA repair protein RadA [Candidatus Falkowbacteria bacterium]|nr:DNA repair protein RadA [Candidatus Falkowbacteria bacterium]
MAKLSTVFVCKKCDAQFPKWSGRCTECGSWGTLEEQSLTPQEQKSQSQKPAAANIINLKEINERNFNRLSTGLAECDRVLGGGLMPDSFVLLAGEPGIGKSTLVAQLAGHLAKKQPVLYVSGEESAHQVKERLERLSIDPGTIGFLNETNVEKIVATAEESKPVVLIVDSIQTIYSFNLPSEAGSVSQIRASAVKLLELAKQKSVAVILIGHITKDGAVAGPKSLEHIVDTVLYLESETQHDYRLLRASKNRFGSVNELGVFSMTGSGFEEVVNPGGIFLEADSEHLAGAAVSCILEGTRPFLVEVQALVTKTVFGYPQRKASGFDLNRLQVLIAVLMKRAKVNLSNQDVIINVVGGLRINDPALDLAVCAAIISSLLNEPLPAQTIALGEVGLGGEVRPASKLGQRLNEAEKLGFVQAMVPAKAEGGKKIKALPVKNVDNLASFFTFK